MKRIKKYLVFNKKTFFTFFVLGILALITEPFIEGYLIRSAIPNQIKSFLLFITNSLFFLFVIFLIDIRKKNFAKSLSFVTGGISVLLFVLILFTAVFGIPDRFLRKQFDSASWKNERSIESSKSIRLRMIDDLRDKHKLEGKSKKEIDQLLGFPNENKYSPEYDYVYGLGSVKGLIENQSLWLAIKFRDDVVVKTEILRRDM